MAVLHQFNRFDGRHPETGSVHNILAYQGNRAPHTGAPYSEALLLGISGGITFGYFTFDYQGSDPILSLLTRNTFDPLQTMLERLGIPQTVMQTGKPETGEQNLIEALENGQPALVWADRFSLGYNGLDEAGNWDMQPLVVFGIEDGEAYLADRSSCPITVPVEELAAARARIKKDKFRVVTLGSPDETKLRSAVREGIEQCIRLYTEKPPKGAVDNFGFAALQKWAEMLTNIRNKGSWRRFFDGGARLFAALAGNAYLPGAYGWIEHWGTRRGADRGTYADFLSEAALVLDRPGIKLASEQFRVSAGMWEALADALLPENHPILGEARRLKDRSIELFLNEGAEAQAEIYTLHHRLGMLREQAGESSLFSPAEQERFFEGLSARVLAIKTQELAAITALTAAMS